MRIIGGAHKGLALASVGKGDLGAHLRPTTDRVRESLFNVLMGGKHGDPITGARVLELFAGTGALGLEALSRGASHVTFVENGRMGGKLIHDNIAKLGRRADTTLIKRDATRLGPCNEACDLIFLDPPYGKGLGALALQAALEWQWINEDALIVWEEAAPQPAPEHFTAVDARAFGGTHITFLRFQP